MNDALTDGLFICGGCNAKIGPGELAAILNTLPQQTNNQLLVGFDSADDAAVYKLTDEIAMIQTLDFFPTMVSDPTLFGQIAATNAMSDVFAMGGEVLTAMNIVCWPEDKNPALLGDILKGGQEKVQEAGGVLVGGHSIHDSLPKYGLSVSGQVHPEAIYRNNTSQVGDRLILTKPLGTGIITTAYSAGEMSEPDFQEAVVSMTTLNMYAARIFREFTIHACTDVTGFGLLGHLNEMIGQEFSAYVETSAIPYFKGAYKGAQEFLITAGGQRNRNALEGSVVFEHVDFAMEELLYDPQTSGGLLASVPATQAEALLLRLQEAGIPAGLIGVITEKESVNITVM